MAMEAIDNALVSQFSDSVHVAAQQIRARLRGAVQIKQMSGDLFAYDGLGSVEASEVIGRHQPVSFSDINHLRRKISRRRFALTLPIDASDVRGMLLNPQSEYAIKSPLHRYGTMLPIVEPINIPPQIRVLLLIYYS